VQQSKPSLIDKVMACKYCTLSQFILGFKKSNPFFSTYSFAKIHSEFAFFSTATPCKVCQNSSCLWNLDTVMVKIYIVVISLLFAKVQ